MPPKGRKTYRKKKGKKRNGRKSLISMVPNQRRIFKVLFEGFYTVAQAPAGAGGIANWQSAVSINFPGQGRNVANTYGALTSQPNILPRCMAMFDEYRVDMLEVRWVPNEQEVRVNSANPDLADTPSVIYFVVDDTNSVQLIGETYATDQGAKARHLGFEQKLTVRGKKNYIDTGQYQTTSLTAPTQGTLVPSSSFGSVKVFIPNLVYATGLSANTFYYGRIYCRWHVTFRGISSIAA